MAARAKQTDPGEAKHPRVAFADIQREVGEYKTALDSYNEVLDDAWAVGDAYICVYVMDAIANTHRLMGDLVQAESWAGRASAEAEKTEGDDWKISTVWQPSSSAV